MAATIREIKAREILDSRGNPTVEAVVVLSDGAVGLAGVPSGASTGAYGAVELRDGDPKRYGGKGTLKAVDNIRKRITPVLINRDAYNQENIDQRMITLDGTANKGELGANATLAVSLAVAHAVAASKKVPLYESVKGDAAFTLPVPMFNILNGGRHASNSADVQEFMVSPVGVDSFKEALRCGAEIYQALKSLLHKQGQSTNVGDEGGFAPSLPSNTDALEVVIEAVKRAGYKPGENVWISLDVAASEWFHDGKYKLEREGKTLTSAEVVSFLEGWTKKYPILSIEDGMDQEDWKGWGELTRRVSKSVQLVGDDLYVTNTSRLERGIKEKSSNAILIKLNQIGTLTETRQAVQMAKKANWGNIMSHRSGETEDTTIADLSVAWACDQIKTGAPARSERVAKYNRLLRIEEELGSAARYAGWDAYKHVR